MRESNQVARHDFLAVFEGFVVRVWRIWLHDGYFTSFIPECKILNGRFGVLRFDQK